MQSKTILFVNPWRGIIGPNVGMLQMAQEAVERGHNVHVVVRVWDEFSERLRQMGAIVQHFPRLDLSQARKSIRFMVLQAIRSWRVSRQIGDYAKDIKADVICVNGENLIFVPRAGRIAKCPVYVIVRGLRFHETGTLGKAFFLLQRRWVRQYIAVSHSVAGALRIMKIPERRIITVCNGVDTNAYYPGFPSEQLQRELGIQDHSQVIVAVCHIERRKGIHWLIEALAEVKKSIPEVKCLVVGGASTEDEIAYEKTIRSQADILGVSDQLILAGYRSDVSDLIRLADIVVHPSETESFGRTISEAMACEKAVIGFHVGAVPELIDHEKTGFVIQPFDTHAMAEGIVTLLHNEELRMQMGRAGREKVCAKYDLNENKRLLIDLLVSRDQ